MLWNVSGKKEIPENLVQTAADIWAGYSSDPQFHPYTGWIDVRDCGAARAVIQQKATRWQSMADTLVLVGVGGSNQAARGVLDALGTPGMDVIYAGNTLSPRELRGVLDSLEGKSACMHVIAKNFETLEPGSHYRVLRQYFKERYSEGELAERVVITGSENTRLEAFAREQGHLFLPFPLRVGGRYSAFTNVALLPIAAAGQDINAYLQGAKDMLSAIQKDACHPAFQYAAWRNARYAEGKRVEVLAAFEPCWDRLCRWWRQLFGESEGKEGRGIFPAYSLYSEDLHSMGQYMQQGERILMETFLSVTDPGAVCAVPPDPNARDGFDYLDGMDFDAINKVAESATLAAHRAGGVPCAQLTVPRIDAYAFGQLYFFFMAACAVSGGLLGVNPFDQDGVEAYKQSMFSALGKV